MEKLSFKSIAQIDDFDRGSAQGLSFGFFFFALLASAFEFIDASQYAKAVEYAVRWSSHFSEYTQDARYEQYIMEKYDGLFSRFAGLSALIGLCPWYLIMSKLSKSLNNISISKMIKICLGVSALYYGLMLFPRIPGWIGVIACLAALVCNVMIAWPCIRQGDEEVRRFGKMQLYCGIIASAVCQFLLSYLFAYMDADYFMMVMGGLLVGYLQYYPLRYMLYTIADKG